MRCHPSNRGIDLNNAPRHSIGMMKEANGQVGSLTTCLRPSALGPADRKEMMLNIGVLSTMEMEMATCIGNIAEDRKSEVL
jgi:hypothetical protein